MVHPRDLAGLVGLEALDEGVDDAGLVDAILLPRVAVAHIADLKCEQALLLSRNSRARTTRARAASASSSRARSAAASTSTVIQLRPRLPLESTRCTKARLSTGNFDKRVASSMSSFTL